MDIVMTLISFVSGDPLLFFKGHHKVMVTTVLNYLLGLLLFENVISLFELINRRSIMAEVD
jgi:hypothetical protein